MWKHRVLHHQGEETPFTLKAVGFFKTALSRQTAEAVRIRRRGGEGAILNSKAEYNRCFIPRLTVLSEDVVKEMEEEEDKLEMELNEEITKNQDDWEDRRVEVKTREILSDLESSKEPKKRPGGGYQGKRKIRKLNYSLMEDDWGESRNQGRRPGNQEDPASTPEDSQQNSREPPRKATEKGEEPCSRIILDSTGPWSELEESNLHLESDNICLVDKVIPCTTTNHEAPAEYNKMEENISIRIVDRKGAGTDNIIYEDKNISLLSSDTPPRYIKTTDPPSCQEALPPSEPSVDKKDNAGQKVITKKTSTFPSMDIRYHLLNSSSDKKLMDISRIPPDVSYDMKTSKEDKNPKKKSEDITIPDAPKAPATITPSPSPSHNTPDTPDTTKPRTTTPHKPHPSARKQVKKMKNSPMTPNSTKRKKDILKKKIEDKKTITDIRKFWKNIDKGDRDKDKDILLVDNKSVVMINDPGKLKNKPFVRTECAKAECDFDEARVCRIHGCVAEKIVVKVSKYKKNVGFVKESVTKLKCMGRTKGMESPRISTACILPVPAQLMTNSGDIVKGSDTGLALEAHRKSDWLEYSEEKEYSDVIGAS